MDLSEVKNDEEATYENNDKTNKSKSAKARPA